MTLKQMNFQVANWIAASFFHLTSYNQQLIKIFNNFLSKFSNLKLRSNLETFTTFQQEMLKVKVEKKTTLFCLSLDVGSQKSPILNFKRKIDLYLTFIKLDFTCFIHETVLATQQNFRYTFSSCELLDRGARHPRLIFSAPAHVVISSDPACIIMFSAPARVVWTGAHYVTHLQVGTSV